MSVFMLIPAFNEAENLEHVFDDIKTNFPEADVLVVNDCSKDNTIDVLRKADGIEYLDLPVNLGYSYAVQSGLKYGVQENYDYLIQFDGDGQHLASEAKKMYEHALKTDADIVLGSRFMEKTDYPHSFFRRVGTTMFQWIIKILTGKKIFDPTSGLQVVKRSAFTPLSRIYAYPEFPDANLLIELIYQGYSIEEVAVQMKQREFGESMHSGIIKPVKYMFKMFYYVLLIFFNNVTGKRKIEKHDSEVVE